jgi:pyruvate dehydrogenase E1 component
VVAGAYPVLRTAGGPRLTIAAMGAVVPEALAAAERLSELGVPADVVCVTSPGLLFRALRARQGVGQYSLAASPQGPPGEPWILAQAFPAVRATPLVTVLDGHPHTLSFLATVNRVPHAALGVAQFGQSGAIEDLYRYNGIDTDSIIRAALDIV